MKKLIFGTAAFMLLAMACKKNDSSTSPNGSQGTNSWKVGATSFTPTYTEGVPSNGYWLFEGMTSLTPPMNAIEFIFNGTSAPVAGTYKVVAMGTPAAGQVVVNLSEQVTKSGGPKGYFSTGNGNVNATVTATNGKVSISLPDIWARDTAGRDSVKVSANITQL